MKGNHRSVAFVVVSLWLTAVPLVSAQSPTSGTINGIVTDNTGAVLPGVTVTATSPNLMGSQTAVTNDKGQYRFPLLPPGDYKLTYELAGFGRVVREGIHIAVGFAAEVDVSLQLSSLQESVTVTGQSPLIDTQNTSVQNHFGAELLKTIPNARDIWSLLDRDLENGTVLDLRELSKT